MWIFGNLTVKRKTYVVFFFVLFCFVFFCDIANSDIRYLLVCETYYFFFLLKNKNF